MRILFFDFLHKPIRLSLSLSSPPLPHFTLPLSVFYLVLSSSLSSFFSFFSFFLHFSILFGFGWMGENFLKFLILLWNDYFSFFCLLKFRFSKNCVSLIQQPKYMNSSSPPSQQQQKKKKKRLFLSFERVLLSLGLFIQHQRTKKNIKKKNGNLNKKTEQHKKNHFFLTTTKFENKKRKNN